MPKSGISAGWRSDNIIVPGADPEIGFRGDLYCLFLSAEGDEPRRQRRRKRDAEGVEGCGVERADHPAD